MAKRTTDVPRKATSRVQTVPEIIPPKTVVELVKADRKTPAWRSKIGTRYRVGYYGEQDGLETIWLVDEGGTYCQTTDRDYLLKYFHIIRLSKETNYFGHNKRRLGRLKKILGKIKVADVAKRT